MSCCWNDTTSSAILSFFFVFICIIISVHLSNGEKSNEGHVNGGKEKKEEEENKKKRNAVNKGYRVYLSICRSRLTMLRGIISTLCKWVFADRRVQEEGLLFSYFFFLLLFVVLISYFNGKSGITNKQVPKRCNKH